VFESVAFGTHAKYAAFDKDKLREGKDSESNVNEYVVSVCSACTVLGHVVVVVG
jgi:hypothetical protein